MGGMRSHSSPTRVAKKVHVGFADSLVTGFSRPLNNLEHWTLYYFETHASECKTCYNPYKVYKMDRLLCDDGHELAIDVADLLFEMHPDGSVYTQSTRDNQEVRVEVPANYKHTLGLFKAISRHAPGFLKPKPSLDRHYQISPRSLRRHKEEQPVPEQPIYNIRLAEPTRRRDSHRLQDRSKRGSLAEIDEFDLEEAQNRENRARYNLEVREPSFRR